MSGKKVKTVIDSSMEEDIARVLLVEDHASFRQALAFMFDREPNFTVVGQAGSLAEGFESLRAFSGRVDIAVVDIGLSDGDGIELIRELSLTQPGVTTLVLSASVDPTQFAEAVEAGASGVLHKSAPLSEIVDAVGRLKTGEVLLTPDETIEMLRMASRKRHEEERARRAIEKLTPREREVLQALAEGLDSRDIAKRLAITVETERTHMVNIMRKLEVHSRLQALWFAVRYGVVEVR